MNFFKNLPKLDEKESIQESKKSFLNLSSVIPEKRERERVISIPTITANTDILTAHSMILKYLSEKNNCLQLRGKLERLRWIECNSENSIEIINAKKEIFKIEKELASQSSGKDLEEYKNASEKLINKYKSIHMGKRSFIDTNGHGNAKADKIYKKFLFVAKNYVPINIKQKEIFKCGDCGSTNFEVVEIDIYRCENCSICVKILEDMQTFKDTDRLNMTSRYTYSKRSHFIEAIQKFQGIKNTKINEMVYTKIYEQMETNNITKDTLTKEYIYMLLSENGYSKYYEDIPLIYSTITGKPSPNISQYESMLMDMYDKQEKVFDDIKNELGRSSSQNVYYKLMKMLQILGYPCNIKNFNCLKTRDKLLDHDDAWKKICERLGWTYIPTI